MPLTVLISLFPSFTTLDTPQLCFSSTRRIWFIGCDASCFPSPGTSRVFAENCRQRVNVRGSNQRPSSNPPKLKPDLIVGAASVNENESGETFLSAVLSPWSSWRLAALRLHTQMSSGETLPLVCLDSLLPPANRNMMQEPLVPSAVHLTPRESAQA